jgi:DNA polymerase I-like protein with 3'-5' exonuclease and polymerase domains
MEGNKYTYLDFLIESTAYRISLNEDKKELIDELAKYLSNDKIRKVTFGVKDIHRLGKKYGFILNGVSWDGELMAYLINPEEPEMSLHYLRKNT